MLIYKIIVLRILFRSYLSKKNFIPVKDAVGIGNPSGRQREEDEETKKDDILVATVVEAIELLPSELIRQPGRIRKTDCLLKNRPNSGIFMLRSIIEIRALLSY